ncbi:MAG: HAD family hydrolase [Streptococcaceae bacterium]|jgi:phosphoglycolate phosphatase-like HAD superfamily hydrolase|nr:HAD family hydrolase [Streptococcaceae bacterium]
MKNIKLIACDTDGVILEDTYSPILNRLSIALHIPYTSEIERNTFSRDDATALKYVSKIAGIKTEKEMQELYKLYFLERDKYIQETGNHPVLPSAPEFLKRLRSLGIPIICYGGLPLDKIDNRAKPFLEHFDQYICTGTFRPGLKEIVKDIYHFDYSEVLFIDDVNTVAEEAKKYNIPFIGVPTTHSWGFQKQDMEKTRVKYTVNSVEEITLDYLETIDGDKEIWNA